MPGLLRARVLLLAGLVAGVGADLRAQEPPPAPPARPITEAVERTARELWPLDMQAPVDADGRPRFRTSVTEDFPELPPPWFDNEPKPFHQRGTLYHREFLAIVTPEEFRGSTFWPMVSVSVDPGTIRDGVRRAWQQWQTQRIRARIARELEELRARGGDTTP